MVLERCICAVLGVACEECKTPQAPSLSSSLARYWFLVDLVAHYQSALQALDSSSILLPRLKPPSQVQRRLAAIPSLKLHLRPVFLLKAMMTFAL